MKTSKTPIQIAKNASKLHKHIGKILISDESPYKNYEIRQEYPVSKVNPDYVSNRERFDWVILGLNIVIEVHGRQHYEPTCFGGVTIDVAKSNYRKRLYLDEQKQTAATEALWAYVVVKYTEKNITIEELSKKILDAMSLVPEGIYEQKKPKSKIQNRGFQKQEGKYKWPTRKIQNKDSRE